MKSVYSLIVLLALTLTGTARAEVTGYGQSYDANGHYLRLPSNYQQQVTRQGNYTYVAPQPASMYPQGAISSTTVVAPAPQSMLPATTVAERPMPQPVDVAPVAYAPSYAPTPVLVSDASTANSLMPAAGARSLMMNDSSAVRIGKPCDTGMNHRAHNKGLNTSTTVNNDCLD